MSQNKGNDWWKGKYFASFTNRKCEYFPCHAGADSERFSCLFCYCPLYVLGPHCGGNFTYLDNGVKDCSSCLVPHNPDNYGSVTARFREIQQRCDTQPEHPPTYLAGYLNKKEGK